MPMKLKFNLFEAYRALLNMISNNQTLTEVLLAVKGFDFERNHDAVAFRRWALANKHIAWYIAAMYVVIIFLIKKLMQNRKKFNLRPLLAFWNFLTAIFSIIATWRTLPYLYRMLSTHGLAHTICDESLYNHEVVSFWGSLFMLSKVPELFDTLFIVLRKQDLILLHWYHHASVVLLVFYSYPSWVGSGLFYMTMNYTVHAFMYTYYMLRAMTIPVPRIVNITITTMQIIQMILACWITGMVYVKMAIRNETCGTETMFQVHRTMIVYLSYLILFIHYFLGAYCKPKNSIKKND